MNKMILTAALAGFLVAAPSLVNAATTTNNSQQQSPNFTRGACTGTTEECAKQVGTDTVGGVKEAGNATVNVAKSVGNTVVGGVDAAGKAIAKPFEKSSQ